ncbi:SAP domain-containing ribonucleoprotein [Triplophysa tibetana]|uniref:SAP domain-containing ribonucleoprotein n=1 Tax=Triplophysa tibetana TaxID=1572043 RepID=A0A5A9NDM2_9TELE|nr:SAP domain-containing ribonucleoprotein [Triplophysa tibetana]
MAEFVELQKLKLAELKQECVARGLDAKGNKGDLIARLQAYLDEQDGCYDTLLYEKSDVKLRIVKRAYFKNAMNGLVLRVLEATLKL